MIDNKIWQIHIYIYRIVMKQSLIHKQMLSDCYMIIRELVEIYRGVYVRRAINPGRTRKNAGELSKGWSAKCFLARALWREFEERARTRSPSRPAFSLRDIFRSTISFLETLVNISVKGAAGEFAGPANRNRAGFALSKNHSQDTLGRVGAKRMSRRARSCPWELEARINTPTVLEF